MAVKNYYCRQQQTGSLKNCAGPAFSAYCACICIQADFVPLGSSIMPMMGTEDVMWTCNFRNGLIKRFKFPIRTTAEGAANAYEDLKGKDMESGLLSTEEADGFTIPRPKELCEQK